MRGRSKSVPANKHSGFFDVVAESINRRGSLPPLVREKSLDAELKATELDLMMGLINGLNVLHDVSTDEHTKLTAKAGVDVIQSAHDKLSRAENISVFNAAPQIFSFLWNKKSYNASMEEVRVMFTKIVVDRNSISYWDALEIKMRALYHKTESRYEDEHRDKDGHPLKDEKGSYLPLDDGDKYFKSITGMCKFDLIVLFGHLSQSVRDAISVYEKANASTLKDDEITIIMKPN